VLRTVCTALLAVLVVGGCTAGSGSREASSAAGGSASSAAGSSASTAAGSSASSAAPAVPRAPEEGACYRLSTAQLTRSWSDSRPVPCSSRHTSRTIFVGLHDGHQVAADKTCPRKLAGYVGGSARTRDLSRFNVVWFSPTPAQREQGATWFRCDLIVFSGTDSLFPLPRKGPGVKRVLDRPDALATYGLCGTAAPGSARFERVICARRHSWVAFDTIGLAGGKRYPGVAKVDGAGLDECRSRAAARAGNALRYRYGWEYPTRAQWAAGQRFGYCWMPG